MKGKIGAMKCNRRNSQIKTQCKQLNITKKAESARIQSKINKCTKRRTMKDNTDSNK